MASKEQLRERFQATTSKKQYGGMITGKDASELLTFIENSIKKQFQSFSLFSTLCGAQRRIKVNPQFESTFLALSLEEKVTYYELAVTAVLERQKETSIHFLTENEVEFQTLPIKVIKGLKTGPSYKIKMTSYAIDCSHYEISLKNYLLRRSKKNTQIFILESLAQQEPLVIRFELVGYTQAKDTALTNENNRNWTKYILSLSKLDDPEGQKVKLSKKEKEQSENWSPTKKTITVVGEIESRSRLSPTHREEEEVERSVIHEVFNTGDDNIEQEIYELIEQKELELSKSTVKSNPKHFRKNVARIMLPNQSLAEIENFNDYLPFLRDEAKRLYIYQHSIKKCQFRMELYLRQNWQQVARHLCEIQNYKLWNGSINESHVKLSISSDNAYLAYLKQRAYSNVYRERDFLFLRHLCRVGESFFLIDSSIQNSHFIPFSSIIRGKINYCITKVDRFNDNECRLLMEMSVDQGGMLNLQNDVRNELAVRYLREFTGLESYITRFKGEFKNPIDIDWEICLSESQSYQANDLAESNVSITSNLFEQPLSSVSLGHNDEDDFYSIADDSPPIPQITEEQLLLKQKKQKEMTPTYTNQKIQLTSEGYVILPKKYLKVRHAVGPIKLQQRRKLNPFKNLMLKNDFVEEKCGGMKLCNDIKAAAQNNVIKFIMQTIKKNLFSGKGILNISLPVEIFNNDSNIQRLCESMSVAPDLIERKTANPIERFKNCVAFAFTNSVLYFDIDKPFNPILGQTFQGFIDGCPIYAEQISHHPPISSVLFLGRGYKVYGNVEAKVYVHLNSGEGVNEGLFTIEFQDGGKVAYQTAPGEVSGLTVGDRKFRFKGKTYIIDARNRLFCAINFEDESGIFSKSKWTYTDQVEGEILRVTENFVHNFFESKEGKEAICPGKKDIEQRLGKVSGRWLQSFKIDDTEYFNLTQPPHEMIHYQYPLNSNSDYRQDLLYRKLNDLARSQSEKERLEVLQRNDRKFREKYHPGKH